MNSWLLFALLTPVLWGFANVMDSAIRRNYVKNDFAMSWFLGITRIPFIIAFFAMDRFSLPSAPLAIGMLIAGVFWLAPFSFYYKALEFEETSRVVLLIQMIPVFVLLLGFFVIGERLTALQAAAFVFLLLGNLSLVKVALGPIRTSSSTKIPSHR